MSWRCGDVVAKSDFDGITLEVVRKPAICDNWSVRALPGVASHCYEVTVFGGGNCKIATYLVSWPSADLRSVSISRNLQLNQYEVWFDDSYKIACTFSGGDMPWMKWELSSH